MTRRDDRAYREYVSEEQRRQPGCPAREVVLVQCGLATSIPRNPSRAGSSALGIDHRIIGAVEPLAFIVVDERSLAAAFREHGEPTVAVLAGDELALVQRGQATYGQSPR